MKHVKYPGIWLLILACAFVIIAGVFILAYLELEREPCNLVGMLGEPIEPIIHTREVKAKVYAYNSSVNQTDDDPFTMASGKQVYDGAIACPDPSSNIYHFGEFGDKVEIEGRIYICEDRMAKRYRHDWNFDIWMSDYEQACDWGVKDLTIKLFI